MVNARAIVETVAAEAGQTYLRVVGHDFGSRCRIYVDIRQEAAKRLRDAGLSYPEIGRQLGNRDHSTIISLLRRPPRRAP